MRKFNNHGFTLFELILSLIIIAVISTIGISSYKGVIANQALSSRANQIYYTLQFAKSEAINRNKKIYVQFCQQQLDWRMGLSEDAHCDCFSENSCLLDGIETVYELADGKTLLIGQEFLKFTGDQASYGPLRFSVETGSIILENSEGNALSIVQSAMRLRICAPEKSASLLGYPEC